MVDLVELSFKSFENQLFSRNSALTTSYKCLYIFVDMQEMQSDRNCKKYQISPTCALTVITLTGVEPVFPKRPVWREDSRETFARLAGHVNRYCLEF